MAAPQSTPLPEAPTRGEAEGQFVPKANAFVGALEPFRQQLQAQADFVNERSTEVEENVALAQEASEMALSSANFAGDWSGLSGAFDVPTSVLHDDTYWQLLEDVSNIQDDEPGVSDAWAPINVARNVVLAIPDITALSSLNTAALVDGQQFKRKEFWPGTGVGGVDLYWDASRDVSEHNGGTIIDPAKISELNTTTKTFVTYFTPDTVSGNTGCFVASIDGPVPVTIYGAFADNSTNMTEPLQKCIDAEESTGRAVYIPAGRYLYTTLKIKGRGRRVFGDGRRASELRSLGAYDLFVWGDVSVDVNGYCDSSSLEDIGFLGSEDSTGGLIVPGVDDDNPTWEVASRYNTFDRIRIQGVGNGPVIRNSGWGNEYTQVETWTSKKGLVLGNTSYSVMFDNCTFSGHDEEGAEIPSGVSAEPVTFIACVIQQCGGTHAMIDVAGGRAITFDGLYVEDLGVDTPAVIRVAPGNTSVSVRNMRWSPIGSPNTTADLIHMTGSGSGIFENVVSEGDCNSVLRVSGGSPVVNYSGIDQRNGTAAAGAVLVESPAAASVFGNDHDSKEVTYNKRLATPGFITLPQEIDIADDAVAELEFDLSASRGVLLLSGNSGAAGFALVAYRVGSSIHATDIASTAGVAVTTGVLSGTTGADGDLTISAAEDNKIYVENRTGSARSYAVTLLGQARGVLV